MSTTQSTDGPTADHDRDRVDELADRLDQALDRIDDLEETVEEQAETIDEQASTIRDLNGRLSALAAKGNLNRDMLVGHEGELTDEQEDWVRDHGGLIPQMMGSHTGVLADLEETLTAEQQQRSMADAQIERRVGKLAEAAGIDLDDVDIMGDDKIRRAMQEGAGAVESHAYASHKRAVALLRNIDDVGKLGEDEFGDRFTVNTSQAKQFFRTRDDVRLKSEQVKRVFETIEAWGADSPRHVQADFKGDVNRLVIYLEEADE